MRALHRILSASENDAVIGMLPTTALMIKVVAWAKSLWDRYMTSCNLLHMSGTKVRISNNMFSDIGMIPINTY